MSRSGSVYFKGVLCGQILENDEGYYYTYHLEYLKANHSKAISKTLPLQEEPFVSKTLFAFFDGLIPEGWLLDIAEKNWKLNYRDRMGLLLMCCSDCIGAVQVINNEKL